MCVFGADEWLNTWMTECHAVSCHAMPYQVAWGNLLEFTFQSSHWNLRCPVDLEAQNPGKVLNFVGLLTYPCTRIIALQNSLKQLAELCLPNLANGTVAAQELAQERQGLCRAIVLLQQVNDDVKKSSMDMASQRNILRLERTLTKLAFHSLANVCQ